jgi:hypothetical protein
MNITLTREEAQQVLDDLEALTAYIQGIDKGIVLKIQSIETLRARLSAPEPPCKTGSQCIGGKCPQCVVSEPESVAVMKTNAIPIANLEDSPLLYPAPPQREWQGLTMEEVQEILTDPRYQMKPFIVHAVEAKLKEKNT